MAASNTPRSTGSLPVSALLRARSEGIFIYDALPNHQTPLTSQWDKSIASRFLDTPLELFACVLRNPPRKIKPTCHSCSHPF